MNYVCTCVPHPRCQVGVEFEFLRTFTLVYLTSLSVNLAPSDWMTVNSELERMWKEVVIT
jgi:hypothetical protein